MFWWETAHFDLFIVFSGTVQHWNVIEEGVGSNSAKVGQAKPHNRAARGEGRVGLG